MTVLGNTRPTVPEQTPLQADTIYAIAPGMLPTPQAFSKWSVWLTGSGAGSGMLRGVVYNASSGELVAVGGEVSVDGHQQAGWVDLPAAGLAGAVLPAGSYLFGLWYGGASGALTAAGTSGTGARSSLPVPYDSAGLPLSPLATQPEASITLFVLLFDPWRVPDASDMTLGRLPWELSQRALGVANVPKDTAPTIAQITCGWHGVNFDVETGAFAIARAGGVCEALVGERVLIKRQRGLYVKSATVYCYSLRSFPPEVADEDISLTRRAWLEIANWADDTIPADAIVLP